MSSQAVGLYIDIHSRFIPNNELSAEIGTPKDEAKLKIKKLTKNDFFIILFGYKCLPLLFFALSSYLIINNPKVFFCSNKKTYLVGSIQYLLI